MSGFRVKPVLLYGSYERKEQTSWRPWGAIQTEDDANREVERINKELQVMSEKVDFPLDIESAMKVRTIEEIQESNFDADIFLVYAAGVQENDSIEPLEKIVALDKPVLFFLRKDYLWYEIFHPRFLRKSQSDEILQPVNVEDVVVDDYDTLLWKLRSIAGLSLTRGARVISIGPPEGWGIGEAAVRNSIETWGFEIKSVPYQELETRLQNLKSDKRVLENAERSAEEYLSDSGVELHTTKEFVVNSFVLDSAFRVLLKEQEAEILTVSECMTTIMPISETTACLPLCMLNDSGFVAFCESDFVAIPAGILLHYISQKPVFLVDPTLPYKGQVIVAHCTAPRRMDGFNLEKADILTHFESDYGAAPQVKMKEGQIVTVIDPNFGGNEWIGFRGRILENPTLQICRSQIDIEIEGDWEKLLREMKGFHWLVVYGDYLNEIGYALMKTGITWTNLSRGLNE